MCYLCFYDENVSNESLYTIPESDNCCKSIVTDIIIISDYVAKCSGL